MELKEKEEREIPTKIYNHGVLLEVCALYMSTRVLSKYVRGSHSRS